MTTTHPRISASTRSAALSDLESRGDRPVDLVVIGAGVTGAGIALDAASRGLETVLVDAFDIAFGTSRWSSKLVHGGLRYLATGNVGIAHRSAVERGIIMSRTAPHLTRAIPQVVPVLDEFSILNKVLPRLGFVAGDMLRLAARTSGKLLPRSRFLSPKKVIEFSPTVKREGLRMGFLNWDGQLVDDARLVIALARTAAQQGATVLTKVRASDATGDAVTLTDTLTGDSFRLHARAVVNASGVWAGEVEPGIRVRPSRGTHLVFRAETFGNPTGALTVPVPGETNRFCFVMPEQLGRVFLGLTDEDSPGPIPDVPEVPEEDIDFLISVINRGLDRKVTRDDVIGSFAGLRPLIDTGEDRTADLSRDHAIIDGDTGVASIVGGKLTEYRLMAEQMLDHLIARGAFSPGPCRTRDIPLVGAPGNPASTGTDAENAELPTYLVERFGLESRAVVDACTIERPLDPIAEGIEVTRAEVAWAITHEGALDAADILDRRTRIGLVDADREAALPAVEEILAELA